MNFSCANFSAVFLLNSSMLHFEQCLPILEPESFTTIYLFLVFNGVAIVAANLVVLFLFKQNPSLRRKQNYFLVSLAASDLLAGALTVPLIILCHRYFGYCVAMDTCTRFLAVSTVLHLLTATVERYVKIAKPFRYKVLVTEGRSIKVLIVVWTLSFLTSIMQLFWIDPDASEEEDEKMLRIELIYSSVCLVLFVFLPFIGIVVLDTFLITIIRKAKKTLKLLAITKSSNKRSQRKEKERKAVIVLIAMTVTYAVGWFPYFFLSVIHDINGGVVDIPLWLNVFLLFLKLNSALANPLLYTYLKADFSAALKLTLRKARKRIIPSKQSSVLRRRKKRVSTEETELKSPNKGNRRIFSVNKLLVH